MRLQLSAADNTLISASTYNALFTMHGTTMVFLFVVPMMAGLGNYFVPLMIGARDMAFPKLNALSYWLLLSGGLVFYGSVFFNPPECGWTCYAPLSETAYSPTGGVDAWIFLIHLTGLSSLVGAVNFYATIVNMRAPGMGWGRLPMFVWTILVYAVMLILALPVVAGAVTMLLTDRHFGTHFYDPTSGGSPLLWQHLFWFFGHPEVYIMVLPGFGMISEIIRVRAQADLRLQGDRRGHGGHRLPRPPRVGPPHVLHAEPVHRARVLHARLLPHRGADRGEDLQLDRHDVARIHRVQDADAVRHRLPGDLPHRWHHRHLPGDLPVDWQLTDTYFVVAHLHYVLMGGAVFAISPASTTGSRR